MELKIAAWLSTGGLMMKRIESLRTSNIVYGDDMSRKIMVLMA